MIKLVNETSGKHTAKRLFSNPEYMKKIKTFAIFTSSNPDAQQYSKSQNTELGKTLKKDMSFTSDDFEKTIKSGKWNYYKVKGKYGNVENSYIVYNITVQDAQELCAAYKQQSFIYAYNDDGSLSFEFWANARKPGSDKKYVYKCVDKKDSFDILDNDAEDFYTQISKDYKFSIPFDVFEVAVDDMIESIVTKQRKIKWSDNSVEKCIDESLDTRITSKQRYFARATLYLRKD